MSELRLEENRGSAIAGKKMKNVLPSLRLNITIVLYMSMPMQNIDDRCRNKIHPLGMAIKKKNLINAQIITERMFN